MSKTIAKVIDYKKIVEGVSKDILEASNWPDGGDLDGGTLQDILVKWGILTPVIAHEACGEHCVCAEYYDREEFMEGVTCYRRAEFLPDD